MSMDNFSSENRNNIFVLPQNISNKCCSFCKQRGHNITRCNSDRLLEFEVICSTEVRIFESQYDFKNWLYQNYINSPNILKAFAIRKFHINLRTSVDHCIDIISGYIFANYAQENDEEDISELETDLIRFLDEIRTRSQRDFPQEFYENPGSEQALMREYNIASALQNFFVQNRERNNVNRKLNIITNLVINENDESEENYKNKEICECNICLDEKEIINFVKLGCTHEFCKDCVIKTLKTDQRDNPCCALCRTEIKSIDSRIESVHNELSKVISELIL
jgi:hypothetical protein